MTDAFSRGPRSPSRAVVSDDGVTLQLHAYSAPADGVTPGPPTIVPLSPLMAQELARDLLAAALRHLRAGAQLAPQGREPA